MKTKTIKDPWSFDQPKYDDRNKQAAGWNWGTGVRNPVGTMRQSMEDMPRMNAKEIGKPPLKNN